MTFSRVEGLSLDVSISSRADCKEAELRRAGGQRSGHSTAGTDGLRRRYRCNSKKMKEGLESRIPSFLVSRVALPSTGPKKSLHMPQFAYIILATLAITYKQHFRAQYYHLLTIQWYKIVPLQLVLGISSPTFFLFDKSGKKILFPPASHYR